MTEEEAWERKLSYAEVLQWRGIEDWRDACPTCSGGGVRAYPSTALWGGGIGGSMMSSGTCDQCWGSGNKHRPGPNLRVIQEKLRQLEAIERGEFPSFPKK